MRYVGLFSGINVGSRRIKMADLVGLLGETGVDNPRTFIQSGNVSFSAEPLVSTIEKSEITDRIESAFLERFAFTSSLFLYPLDRFKEIIDLAINICSTRNNALEASQSPYQADQDEEIEISPWPVERDRRETIVFYKGDPPTIVTPITSPKGDLIISRCDPDFALVSWKLLSGKPPSMNFLTNNFQQPFTSRFVHTANKFLDFEQKGSP